MNLQNLRNDFIKDGITIQSTDANPFVEFEKWFGNILNKENEKEPNAMSIASVSQDGQPSIRVVLLKGMSEKGFVFYTNYESKKGLDFEKNPKSCANFFWVSESQQIRIVGEIEKIQRDESIKYFYSRPELSQVSAFASKQSSKIDRQTLEKSVQDIILKDSIIECPEHWGGYILKPTYFEFWQGRPSRLHDRIIYELTEGVWNKHRIAP